MTIAAPTQSTHKNGLPSTNEPKLIIPTSNAFFLVGIKASVNMKNNIRYHTLDSWLRARHGQKVQKIPLDAGFSCPNRDGNLGQRGCTFCNAIGSGSGRGAADLPGQWAYWRNRFAASDRLKHTRLFMGYLQAFTNTYGTTEHLAALLEDLRALPDLIGVCVGTRPDCLEDDKLNLLAEQSRTWPELWLEIGVQSKHDATLLRTNRGHTASCSELAIRQAAARGIKICAHLMADMPGESPADFLETVRWIAGLPVAGVKLHNLYICKGTPLEGQWQDNKHQPMSQADYVALIAEALRLLPSCMVIHRLTGDPAPGELAAPAWAGQKGQTIRLLDNLLDAKNWWQGQCADVPDKNPWQQDYPKK